MDVALPSFILGYHGCDRETAEQVFAGRAMLRASSNDYDWLGDGIYFWEHNAQRAYDFALAMSKRPHPSGQRVVTPSVIGAVLNLGYCLNLLDSRYIRLVSNAHELLTTATRESGSPMPRNSGGRDLVDRKLDCAVIRTLHREREDAGERPFDSVRAAFTEGKPLYENAGFAAQSRLQI